MWEPKLTATSMGKQRQVVHMASGMVSANTERISALLTEIFTTSVMWDGLLYAVNMCCFYCLMDKTALAYVRAEYS